MDMNELELIKLLSEDYKSIKCNNVLNEETSSSTLIESPLIKVETQENETNQGIQELGNELKALKIQHNQMIAKYDVLKMSYERLSLICDTLKVTVNDLILKNIQINISSENKRADIEKLTEKLETLENAPRSSPMITIKLFNESFSVHKNILCSQSNLLKTLIEDNPDAEELDLTNISPVVFKGILKFLYTGIPPDKNLDLIPIYAASCRLQINTLKSIMSGMLKSSVNQDDAYHILIVCNKYIDEELKERAFEEFAKNFPSQKLNFAIASEPQKLKELWDLKLKMEDDIADLVASLQESETN